MTIHEFYTKSYWKNILKVRAYVKKESKQTNFILTVRFKINVGLQILLRFQSSPASDLVTTYLAIMMRPFRFSKVRHLWSETLVAAAQLKLATWMVKCSWLGDWEIGGGWSNRPKHIMPSTIPLGSNFAFEIFSDISKNGHDSLMSSDMYVTLNLFHIYCV